MSSIARNLVCSFEQMKMTDIELFLPDIAKLSTSWNSAGFYFFADGSTLLWDKENHSITGYDTNGMYFHPR